MDEIINRVANSELMVFDLEDYYPKGIRTEIDLSQWLFEGFLLKEKEFRSALKNHDWTVYQDHYVAIHCTTDAILPAWASILVTSYLIPYAKKVVVGTISDLNTGLYQDILAKIDFKEYQDKPVIIKGCAKMPVPENAYIEAIQYLQPVAKSLMYGEACSAVPLFKKAK
jgi:hypothetical protein